MTAREFLREEARGMLIGWVGGLVFVVTADSEIAVWLGVSILFTILYAGLWSESRDGDESNGGERDDEDESERFTVSGVNEYM